MLVNCVAQVRQVHAAERAVPVGAVALSAVEFALRVVDKKVEDVKVVLTGVGAAGAAVTVTLRVSV